MKEAKVLAVRKSYQGDEAVDNVIKYMVNSPFADKLEILGVGIRTDSVSHMIEDFYTVQEPRDMDKHRRLHHMILTTRPSKVQETMLEDGANALADYFLELGYQALLVPHYGGKNSYDNIHWHVAVNAISAETGQRLYDKYDTYGDIVKYLNDNTRSSWSKGTADPKHK